MKKIKVSQSQDFDPDSGESHFAPGENPQDEYQGKKVEEDTQESESIADRTYITDRADLDVRKELSDMRTRILDILVETRDNPQVIPHREKLQKATVLLTESLYRHR